MFAVIKTGGKQYKVKPGDILNIERLKEEEGSEINLEEVLMHVSLEGNLSFENNISVRAEVLSNFRGAKVIAFKKRRRHTYKKKKGHRQDLSKIKILSFETKHASEKEPEKLLEKNKTFTQNAENDFSSNEAQVPKTETPKKSKKLQSGENLENTQGKTEYKSMKSTKNDV